ncbi:MAG: heavy-metal-associated domain-containing protein [Pseudomonadota bacterium]
MAMTQSPSRPFFEALSQPLATRVVASGWARQVAAVLLALAVMGGAYAIVLAQVSGERGIAPTASSADIEVTGIEVDVTAESGAAARDKAWRDAQRMAWNKAGGPAVSDGQLESMVSAIVIQREQIGPKRYIATLGVVFDRQRAGRFLGGAAKQRASAPMLLIPVEVNGGAYTTFETRNSWQRAWAEFNPGSSRIDYVRPTGSGGDSLLLNFGQTSRRSRAWWRTTLDQYGAADALTPIVRLEHQFPGGPVTGHFVARYGPDSRLLGSFKLTADSSAKVPAMLEKAVERMDGMFAEALAEGKLRPDPTLNNVPLGDADPAIARLIQIGRAISRRDGITSTDETESGARPTETTTPETALPTPEPVQVVSNVMVQFSTPDAGAFDSALSGVRGAPGVRSVAVTSTAMGGTSVMSVSFNGSVEQLAAALRGRGFNVRQGANALAISR